MQRKGFFDNETTPIQQSQLVIASSSMTGTPSTLVCTKLVWKKSPQNAEEESAGRRPSSVDHVVLARHGRGEDEGHMYLRPISNPDTLGADERCSQSLAPTRSRCLLVSRGKGGGGAM